MHVSTAISSGHQVSETFDCFGTVRESDRWDVHSGTGEFNACRFEGCCGLLRACVHCWGRHYSAPNVKIRAFLLPCDRLLTLAYDDCPKLGLIDPEREADRAWHPWQTVRVRVPARAISPQSSGSIAADDASFLHCYAVHSHQAFEPKRDNDHQEELTAGASGDRSSGSTVLFTGSRP